MYCSNCGGKVVSRRAKYFMLGFLGLGTGILLLWIPILGIPAILFGGGNMLVGLLLKGYECVNCHRKA